MSGKLERSDSVIDGLRLKDEYQLNNAVQPLLTDLYQLSMAYGYWKNKKLDDKNPITKFMKQSADNISQRQVLTTTSSSSSSTSTEMISIGCQTISTGDITVTNVYIE